MGLLRTVHREVAGALRSARYDVHRQVRSHRMTRLSSAETTEMDRPDVRRFGRPRRPRRVATMTGVALLVAGGAAGTYLAVAGGLALMMQHSPQPAIAAPARTVDRTPEPTVGTPSKPAPKDRVNRRPLQAPPVLVEPGGSTAVTSAPTHEPESTPTAAPSASTSGTPTPTASGASSPSPSAASPSPLRTRTKKSQAPEISHERASIGQSEPGD